MPAKIVAGALACLAVLCVGFDRPVNATVTPRFSAFPPHSGFFKVVTTTTKTSGKLRLTDRLRASVDPIDIQDSDIVSMSMTGTQAVNVGDPLLAGSAPDGLLMFKNAARGHLGSLPFFFPNAKASYNPTNQRLLFSSGRGIATGAPRTTTGSVTVTIHRNRGGGVASFSFSGTFVVKDKISSTGTHTTRGHFP